MQHLLALDKRLVEAVGKIRILSAVAWPVRVQEKFLAAWKAGRMELPQVACRPVEHVRAHAELAAIRRAAAGDHPLADYLRRSADSWSIAAQMLGSLNTAAAGTLSAQLYGRPADRLPGSELSNLDAARHFVRIADELGSGLDEEEAASWIPAQQLRAELAADMDATFGAGRVRVEVDPELAAKAAAGASRIRLRAAARFTRYDRHQLLAHEAFVHTLTAINGREQPHLHSLAHSAPRVTATQEGLAVFAELMSGSIDIARLKRISLRILAIDKALNGADFIEVFRFFRDQGQAPAESFHSAQRVFRGVPLTGGAAFCKDNVYLAGLLTVHTFFRWALEHDRLELTRRLFAGKLALHDVLSLEPLFEAGIIAEATFLPPWVRAAHGLAGKLAFSLFANRIRMGSVEAEELSLGMR